MNSRRNAYKEVYTILQDLNEEEYNKIPPEVIETIKENSNEEYEFVLNDELELKEQLLLPETKAILFNLFRDYLSTSVQKEKIIKMQSEERKKLEEKKKQNYDSVDIFKTNKQKDVEEKTNNQELQPVQIKKEGFFRKIINKIKLFFKNNWIHNILHVKGVKNMDLKELEQEINIIKQRNKRVELDKKWETSGTRKICICILTYIVVVIYSYIVKNYDNIFLSSLVPVIRIYIIYFIIKIHKKNLGKESYFKQIIYW